MRREFELDHERKKTEIQEMRKDFESQRETLLEDAMQKGLERLPPGITREFLT